MNLWSSLSHPACFPNCSCEAMVLDCLVCQPLAFWSSLAYLVAALVLRKQIKAPTLESTYWFWAIIVVTITSFFAHASFTNLSLAVDMAAIINLVGFIHFPKLVSDKELRLRWTRFFFLFCLLSGLIYVLPEAWWVGIVAVAFFISAIHLWRTTPKPLHREKSFLIALVIYLFSFSLFLFDKAPWLCGLDYLPPGHTLWHFGSALTTYLFGRWYFIELTESCCSEN